MYQGCKKYIPFTPVSLPDRTWPNNRIEKAPTWCSVDLRDGNQALVTPMNLQEKLDFFKLLVDIGFKEIEVGFPSASETEYEILRALIDGHYIPDDVTIQVLVQAREHLIRKTFEAVRGAKNVIIHFYNSTSTLQRKVVFKKDMQGIIDIAVAGAKLVRELTEADQSGTNFRYEYSPESFSGTEMDFAVDICHQVMETLGATKENPVILNLPNTVEMCTPNTYADQIEYFIRHLPNGYQTVLSDEGGSLSQGERQLLNIARAACANPPVLILDEATSSIDTRTEKLIEKGMDRLMAGRTVFVIAHRLSTVRNSQAIMVLEQGNIIERGDHEDLIAQHGRYYQLYTGQAELA